MTYKEFKKFNLKIPKGWRCVRMGERFGRKWNYSQSSSTRGLTWGGEVINSCYNVRLGPSHKRNPNTLYIKPK